MTTVRELAVRLCRVALWLLVGLLLVRGAVGLLGPGERPAARAAIRSAVVWPDDQARAFAVSFAHAYLTYSPRRPGHYAQGLARFMPAELASVAAPRFARHGDGQAVAAAVVAGVARVDRSRAWITVSVALVGEAAPRYLGVPVGRDADGALSVFDLPAFEASPAVGQLGPPESEPVSGLEGGALQDVLARFFRLFLAGDAGGLRYLVAPGARVGALGQAHELVAVDSVGALEGGDRMRRLLWVGLRARDVRSRAVYGLRYRVVLVRTDRWYVAAVSSVPKEG